MICKTKGIVLHHIKYGDSSIIVHVYTREFGRQAYMIKGIRKKKSGYRFSLFQPLSILSLEVYNRQTRDLQLLKEASMDVVLNDLAIDMKKSTICLFLAEIIQKSIQEHEPNPIMFEFLEKSIISFDSLREGYVNFHLLFLVSFTKYLGFSPSDNYDSNHVYFDLREGNFTTMRMDESVSLSKPDSKLLHQLINANAPDLKSIRVTGKKRHAFLEKILHYYQLHNEGIKNIQTLQVLKDVFQDG
jgi:DNA repair protein RecO (recombination protein O)